MERMEYDPAAPREWVGLGDHQEVTPHRQQGAETQFDKDVTYAIKSQSHLWTVVLVHRATDQMLKAFDSDDPTDMPMLDADTIAMPPAVCCYMCGVPYADTRERMRKCKGDA